MIEGFYAATPKYVDSSDEDWKAKRVDAINQYFRANWFESTWYPMFMDFSMPPGHSRYNANTNNIVEAAFKTFDKVMVFFNS